MWQCYAPIHCHLHWKYLEFKQLNPSQCPNSACLLFLYWAPRDVLLKTENSCEWRKHIIKTAEGQDKIILIKYFLSFVSPPRALWLFYYYYLHAAKPTLINSNSQCSIWDFEKPANRFKVSVCLVGSAVWVWFPTTCQHLTACFPLLTTAKSQDGNVVFSFMHASVLLLLYCECAAHMSQCS